ncbi:MAG: extracellular solute-binding protein [Caldilineaceae bacterium]|nr:extracellular solute-binding protein [Caldilineaceae bacterium]
MSYSKFSRRQFLQSSAALMGVATLAACAVPGAAPGASSGGEAAPSAAGETVLFWKPPHSPREAELWQPLLEKFQTENAGITVEHQVVPWDSVDQQFTAAFAGGSPPDIFYLPDEWYPKYVNQDQIADLTDLIGDWKANYTTAGWTGATYKGSTWGAPFLGVAQGWVLNMNLFNEKGVAIPTTWEEFRAAAQALTDTDAGVYGIVVDSGATNWTTMIPLLAAGGTKLLSDDLLSVTADSEGGIAAFNLLLEEIAWNDKSSTPVGFTDDQLRSLMLDGKIAMRWQETSSIKAVWRTEAPDIELATIPMLKLTDDGTNASWANIGFMFMAEQSKDKAGAFKLLEYLSTDEIQVEYVQKGVDLLPLKAGIAPLPDVDPIVAEMVSWLGEGWGVGTQISIHWREATTSLVQEAQAVLAGTKTAAQALADVNATVAPVLDGE